LAAAQETVSSNFGAHVKAKNTLEDEGAVLCYDGEAGAVALPSEEAEPRDKGLDWTSVGTCWFSSFAGVLQ